MTIAALVLWIITAAGGFVLLARWIAAGGIADSPTRLPAPVVFAHFVFAAIGLVLWIVYAVVDAAPLAWIAFGLLVVIALAGFAIFARWLPVYRGAPGTEDAPERNFPIVVVAAHGVVAVATVDLNAGAQGWASWWMRGDSSAWWRAWRSLVGLKESGDEVCCGAPVSVTKKMTQVDLYEDRFCGEIGCVADSTVGFDEERAVGFVDEGGGDVHGGVQWDRASILHGEGSGDCGCLGDPQGETHDVIACR